MAYYIPDFEAECRVCGTSPCVVVGRHKQPDTNLCGTCFFDNHEMVDWQLWNDQPEETQDE